MVNIRNLKKDLFCVYELQNDVVGKRFKKTGAVLPIGSQLPQMMQQRSVPLGTNGDRGDF